MTKKAILTPVDVKNPLQLSKQLVAQINADFSPLQRVHLAEKAIRFVVDGVDPSFLLELAGKHDALEAMAMLSAGHSSVHWMKMQAEAKVRGRMIAAIAPAPPECLLRIGQVYAAIRQAHGAIAGANRMAGCPDWLVALLLEIVVTHQHGGAKPVPLTTIEGLLQHAKLDPGLLVAPSLDSELHSHLMAGWQSTGWTKSLEGWKDYYERHVDEVRQSLQTTNADQRLNALAVLYESNARADGWVDLLVDMGCDSSKSVRDAVLQILRRQVESRSEFLSNCTPLIERVLNEGDAGRRNEAAMLLWRICGADARDRLLEHAKRESAGRVKQTIERLVSAPSGDCGEDGKAEIFLTQFPPVEVATGTVPLPEAAAEQLRAHVQKKLMEAQKQYAAELARFNSTVPGVHVYKPRPPVEVKPGELESLLEFIQKGSKKQFESTLRNYLWNLPPLDAWKPPEVQLVHVVRLLAATGNLDFRHDNRLWLQNSEFLERYRDQCHPRFGLRELDAVVASLPNGQSGLTAMAYLAGNNSYHSQLDWEPEAVWPIFVESRKVLHAALGPSPNRGRNYSAYDYSFSDKRRNAFRVLAMLPSLPREFVPLLWDMALGDVKADRVPAQNALATIDGKTEKVLMALQDGRQETRATAADWLGRLGDPQAIEPLKTAFRKEKQEFVKGVYVSALEALGANVDEFLDRKALLKEAQAGLAKKHPKGMTWFPVAAIPAVVWVDTGQPVDPRILHWWVVQTVQQKSPTCGPLLRRYLQMLRPADATALGKFVLSAWISEDTRNPTQEEASERARKDADKQFAQHGTASWFIDYYKDRDNLYRILLKQYSEQFLGSAIGEKGMLALASFTGDADCVKLCEQYLRKYFGHRLAQCKALIEVLAWMKHPLAIQVLLLIGNRFRTKALRQAADDHVHALAEREGWTVDELADRTIPDAGFARPTDEDGRPTGQFAELVLDYGPRSFTVRLDDELEPVITRDDGKSVKAPPAPAKSDDAEKAKAAKKSFSDAKKLVKEVVKIQSERLYEAVCTQRSWRFDDWQRYLMHHPIVGKICTRLVWGAFEPSEDGTADQWITNFRPLEDGSLTNENDEPVTCADNTMIRIAHDCNTPADARPRWIQHLQDYDITPLFQQFGRAVFELPTAQRDTSEIKDFEGHLLTTFKLRGKANKLGWLRGEAGDGGCFMVYRKPFPSLKLQAVLEFTGSYLPEEDVPAALKSLSFEAMGDNREATNSWSRSAVPLKKIPSVLLSECYNDIRQIAAEGTGYDPDWEKKSGF